MTAFDDIKKARRYKSVDMTRARANAKQRALEQREIVIDNIQKKHFLNLSPNSKAWSKVYGTRPNPVQIAPIILSSATDFEKPVASLNMNDASIDPAGTPGIASLASFNAAIPGNYFNISAADRKKDIEYPIAEFPVGVGTDLAFIKPRFPQGEVELATTFSGFLRFRNEIGGPALAHGSGYMNNGIIRFKVVDPVKKTTTVILEVATELFNAAAANKTAESNPTGAALASPGIDYNLKKMLYPNFAHNELISGGSTLLVTVSGLFEGPFISDTGQTYDPATTADLMIIDGNESRFYIETKRLETLDNSQL